MASVPQLMSLCNSFYVFMNEEHLTSDPQAIFEWGRMNNVNFNVQKTQCCLLSYKRSNNNTSSVAIGGISINESDALDILVMKV